MRYTSEVINILKSMHILIIPGWQDPVDNWQPVASILEAVGYSVTILDYVTPKDEDVEDQANQAEYFLTEKTLVVGSSIGGRIAIQLLSRQHHHIVGGMLISTPSMPYTGLIARLFAFIKKVIFLPFIVIPGFMKKRGVKFLQTVFRIPDEKLQYKRVISLDQTSLLQIIKVPIKIVWGRKDTSVSSAIGRKMDALLLYSDYIEVAQAGKDMHIHQHELLANIIDSYARTR